MSLALQRYLKDFGAEPPAPPPPAAALHDAPSFEHQPLFPDIPAAPPIDLEAERRAAFEEGQATARMEMQAEHEAKLAEIAAGHSAELFAMRAKYEVAAAERIGRSLNEISATLAQSISAATAVAFAPLLTGALTEQAVGELAKLVEAAILDGDVVQIDVSGPRNLFEALGTQLGEKATLLRYVEKPGETPDVDLSVTIGDSVLVTRLSAWAGSLKKVLG